MTNKNICTSCVQKTIDVCTPITLETIAHVDDIKVKCYEPDVVCENKKCYRDCCVYEFSIKQTIYIEIPLRYTTDACVKDSSVDC